MEMYNGGEIWEDPWDKQDSYNTEARIKNQDLKESIMEALIPMSNRQTYLQRMSWKNFLKDLEGRFRPCEYLQ